jgi:PPOX class probable F420-dependent enzyme
MALSDEKYMLLTTFRRDGTPVSSPVWVVPLDGGSVGFYTSSESGKAKRLAHTAKVTVQPCDARGRPKAGSATVEGTARVVTGPELEAIRAKIVAKYGVMTKIAGFFNTIAGAIKRKRVPYADRGVVISLTAG